MLSVSLFAGEAKEITYKITGMTCQGCVGKVSGILDKTTGISNYNVSLKNKQCTITYDTEKTNPETIKTELLKTHYTISDAITVNEDTSIFSWLKNLFN